MSLARSRLVGQHCSWWKISIQGPMIVAIGRTFNYTTGVSFSRRAVVMMQRKESRREWILSVRITPFRSITVGVGI